MTALFKKDSKGKLRILNIYTDGEDLVQDSGLSDGKLVTARKTCKGKNIGKSNETTGEQQAILEMDSKIAEKLKTDYFITIDEAMNSQVVLPMLAKDYKEHSGKIDWTKNVFVQPKFDGMRCFAIISGGDVSLISRENTDIIEKYKGSVKHLLPELSKLPDGIYDGELYAHGYTFQENMELIKKYRPGKSEDIKLHCYDFVSNQCIDERLSTLVRNTMNCPAIKLVDTKIIYNEEELKECHSENLGNGYEGTIIRHGQQGYVLNHRSSNLLKYKDFIDIVARVIDVVPMDNRPDQGVLVCTSEDSSGLFRASLKFSHDVRREMLLNKQNYIGEICEIRFFEYTDGGLPRFPVCVGFRLDRG